MDNGSGLLRLNTYLSIEKKRNFRMLFSPKFFGGLFLSLTFIGDAIFAQVVIEGNKGSCCCPVQKPLGYRLSIGDTIIGHHKAWAFVACFNKRA